MELRTQRLHLRPVAAGDLDPIAALGADERVMAPLGGPMSREKCEAWLERNLAHWHDHGYGRFFVTRETDFVGLVGLSRYDFDAGILPGVEIAWRLVFAHWGKGYATEAARAAIHDGATRVGIDDVIAVTTPGNTRSRRVMERLGMVLSSSETFEHPRVPEGDPLRTHVVYRLDPRRLSATT
ncbi:MAG TPA: GNAT family N-acetyltransferase [Polyangiaceae bacterium]|nr:GNAT family N-acetyltransferase [Polyangiaceae bacterium]